MSVLIGLGTPLTASALPSGQLKLFQEGIKYYDQEVCGEADTSGSSPVTSGTGSPTGLQFPNLDPTAMADSINNYVQKTNPSSKLNGLGATLVASAKNADVSPFLVVAIAQQESNLSDPSDYNVSHGNNSFGRTASDGQPSFQGAQTWYYWPSVKASVDFTDPVNQKANQSDEPQYLVDQYGSFIKNNDLSGLVKQYDPNQSEYEKYIPDVTSWISQMAGAAGGQPGNTSTAGGSQPNASTTSTSANSNQGSDSTTDQSTNSGSSTIVLDPGHAPQANELVDPDTKLPVFDYENDPEMQEVWQVAQDVKTKLTQDGYTVLITKNSVDDSTTNLKQRAEVGNNANAALGVSLHTTPAPGNDVFYPAVGDYVVTTDGQHDVYNNQQLANSDSQDAKTMAQSLQQVEGQTWKADTYDNLFGPITRTQDGVVMKGTMLTTQYFAKIPWVYAEQQQNASGAAVSSDTLAQYEQGVVSGIEKIVPPPDTSANSSSSSTGCCPSSSGTTSSSSTSLSGGSNSQIAYNYFINNGGFTPFQSAAIVGNLTQESGVNPKSGDQSAGGIAGFTTGDLSMASMEAWVTSHGEDPSSLQGQLDFLLWYITKDDPTVASDVKKSTSLHDASYAWLNDLERCYNYNVDPNGYACYENKRIGYGEDVLTQYGNGAPDSGSPSTTAASGTGGGTSGCTSPTSSPDCQQATGDTKILCEAKQYDPASYVWGGGHAGGKAYQQACPTIGPGTACGIDCSGLVDQAVYDAFGVNLTEDTYSEASDSQNWQQINFNQVQPGDIIQPDPGHVEIVDHITGGLIYTFGAHTDGVPQPDQVGPVSWPESSSYTYFHWIGKGS